MTRPDLDALEKLADEATPGPWDYLSPPAEGYSTFVGSFIAKDGSTICDFGDCETYYPSEGNPPKDEDIAFMKAANPATIKALIAELKEARGLVEQSIDLMTDEYEDTKAHQQQARAFLARNGKGEG